jgi:hypothetical protein
MRRISDCCGNFSFGKYRGTAARRVYPLEKASSPARKHFRCPLLVSWFGYSADSFFLRTSVDTHSLISTQNYFVKRASARGSKQRRSASFSRPTQVTRTTSLVLLRFPDQHHNRWRESLDEGLTLAKMRYVVQTRHGGPGGREFCLRSPASIACLRQSSNFPIHVRANLLCLRRTNSHVRISKINFEAEP